MKTQWLHVPANAALEKGGEIGGLPASQPSHQDKPLRQTAREEDTKCLTWPLHTYAHQHTYTMHPYPK